MRRSGALACHLGIGLAAGLVGTLAITASQMIEMRLRKRKPSPTPAKAVEKVLGIEPAGPEAEKRLSTLTHFGYGTAWGAFRGLLDSAGVHDPAATALHFAAVEGTAMVMLPALQVAPPVKEWGAQEIAVESLHHLVYVTAVGVTYGYLAGRTDGRGSGFPWSVVVGALGSGLVRRLAQPAERTLRASARGAREVASAGAARVRERSAWLPGA